MSFVAIYSMRAMRREGPERFVVCRGVKFLHCLSQFINVFNSLESLHLPVSKVRRILEWG